MATAPTAPDTATYLGIPYNVSDTRLTEATEAANAWVLSRRSLSQPEALWANADVRMGATMYAALLYQQRSNAIGLAGTDELGSYSEDVGVLMVQIYRLVGTDPVIA